MGRIVVVRRPVTVLLLLLVTAAIIVLTVWMAGKSYTKVDPIPFEEIRHLARLLRARQISTQLLAVIVVPIIANVLLFVPWGFLMFIALYTLDRPTIAPYALPILTGLSLTI